MDIAALLKSLAGMGGDAGAQAAPAGAPAAGMPDTGGGVGAMLASAQGGPQGPPPQPSAPPPAAGAIPPGPSTPPATDSGLGGFLSRMVQKATTRDPETGLSFADRFQRFGAQMGDNQRAAEQVTAAGTQRVNQGRADARRAQLQQMADSLGMDPREKLIFQANPEAWVSANAKRLEPATVPGGDTRVTPGETPYTAPKVGQEGGEGYSVTPGGMKDLGGLAPSPQQDRVADAAAAQQEAMNAYHKAMVRIAQERAAKVGAAAPQSSGLPAGYVPR